MANDHTIEKHTYSQGMAPMGQLVAECEVCGYMKSHSLHYTPTSTTDPAAIDLDRARRIADGLKRMPGVPCFDGSDAKLIYTLIADVEALRERVAELVEALGKQDTIWSGIANGTMPTKQEMAKVGYQTRVALAKAKVEQL